MRNMDPKDVVFLAVIATTAEVVIAAPPLTTAGIARAIPHTDTASGTPLIEVAIPPAIWPKRFTYRPALQERRADDDHAENDAKTSYYEQPRRRVAWTHPIIGDHFTEYPFNCSIVKPRDRSTKNHQYDPDSDQNGSDDELR